MGTIGQVRTYYAGVPGKVNHLARQVLAKDREGLLEAQRDQLYAGLTPGGKPIALRYSQDPYFKRPGAGARYAAWKATLSPRRPASYLPPRPLDVPNLIITGRAFYDKLQVTVTPEVVRFEGGGLPLELKYGPLLGLSPPVLKQYRAKRFYPRFGPLLKRLLKSDGV